MSYPTPPADFDGVAVGLRLLEKAVDLIDVSAERPERRAETLQEAAHLLKDAWMAVQTAAGRALKESGKQEPADSYTEDELNSYTEDELNSYTEDELNLFGPEGPCASSVRDSFAADG